jgi:pimeloyl-ACP methyl ester carboxylesterase
LSGDAEVVPFAYDWRQSIANAAAELAAVIDGVGDRVVHIVAHGSGGLVVRALALPEGQVQGSGARHPTPRRSAKIGL